MKLTYESQLNGRRFTRKVRTADLREFSKTHTERFGDFPIYEAGGGVFYLVKEDRIYIIASRKRYGKAGWTMQPVPTVFDRRVPIGTLVGAVQ